MDADEGTDGVEREPVTELDRHREAGGEADEERPAVVLARKRRRQHADARQPEPFEDLDHDHARVLAVVRIEVEEPSARHDVGEVDHDAEPGRRLERQFQVERAELTVAIGGDGADQAQPDAVEGDRDRSDLDGEGHRQRELARVAERDLDLEMEEVDRPEPLVDRDDHRE